MSGLSISCKNILSVIFGWLLLSVSYAAEFSEIYKGSDFGTFGNLAPGPLALDSAGNLFFVVGSGEIMRVTPEGVLEVFLPPITTGSDFLSGSAFLEIDHLDNLFVGGSLATDKGFNAQVEAVFKVSQAKKVTELFRYEAKTAGITLSSITDGVVDDQGNLYVSGYVSDNVIRIGVSGGVTEILHGPTLLGDIPFESPRGLSIDSLGSLYVAATSSSNVIKLTPSGEVHEIISERSHGNDLLFTSPFSIVANQYDELFVSSASPDGGAFIVYPDGLVIKAIDESGDGTGVIIQYGSFGHVEYGLEFTGEPLIGPRRAAVDSLGNFYVVGEYSDNVFRINRDGSVIALLGRSTRVHPTLENPQFVVVGSDDAVYVSSYGSGSRNIVRIDGGAANGQSGSGSIGSVFNTFNDFPNNALNPIMRFYNPRDNAFFYTESVDEKNLILANSDAANPPSIRWPYIYQGSTYSSAHSYSGAVPLHRFYNYRTGHHFFTASTDELEYVNQNIRDSNWPFAYEGVAFQVYLKDPTPGFNGLETPVFRLYSYPLNRHFFTASQAEASLLVNTGEWDYEGIGFYGELH